MSMYEERGPLADTRELVQGDILVHVPVPALVSKAAFHRREGVKATAVSGRVDVADENLRILVKVITHGHAIVLSNTCDNYGGREPLILAPVVPYRFRREGMTPADQWRDISEAATGTASPKVFYLAGEPRFTLLRSEGRLAEVFTISHDYLRRCIDDAQTTRLGGLSPEAQRHLQWAISAMFSRDPRDDDAWPSEDDLRLKLAWLEAELERGSPRQEQYKADRKRIAERLGIALEPPAPGPAAPQAPMAGESQSQE